MSVVFVWVVAAGLGNGWQHDPSFGFMLLTVCALVIMLLAAWAQYRNFVFRDALYIAREGSLPSSVPLRAWNERAVTSLATFDIA